MAHHEHKPLAIALVSGGLDSVTLAHVLDRDGLRLHLLSCDYGQRHVRELACAQACARRLGAEWDRIDLHALAFRLPGSALTDHRVAVPEGHYTDERMKATVVPNRNAILLAIAYGIAVAEGASYVATAMHAGDHAIYPDCRSAFIVAFQQMELLATEGFARPDLTLWTPFLYMTKAEIVTRGAALRIPFAETWSCYRGGTTHCGRCGACCERREAFKEAGVPDPTLYEDTAVTQGMANWIADKSPA